MKNVLHCAFASIFVQMSYFSKIARGIKSTAKGMGLTLKHAWNARKSRSTKAVTDKNFFENTLGHVTLQYPHQKTAIPDVGRNQLDCEIEDCIVCDKCAKVCPVDCIEIEAIKSPELIRYASDGSPVRLHAAKFDIDMAKCCFCGLCTSVCPTECLTMNSEYDYATLDVTQLNFAFSTLSQTEANEKRYLYEQFMAEKNAVKEEKAVTAKETNAPARPVFRPSQKPIVDKNLGLTEANKGFRPSIKPPENDKKGTFTPRIKPSTSFKPSLKPNEASTSEGNKPKFSPSSKPTQKAGERDKKPSFKPTIKPKTDGNDISEKVERPPIPTRVEGTPLEKPKFVPSLKPKENPKPSFKPTLKPKNDS